MGLMDRSIPYEKWKRQVFQCSSPELSNDGLQSEQVHEDIVSKLSQCGFSEILSLRTVHVHMLTGDCVCVLLTIHVTY